MNKWASLAVCAVAVAGLTASCGGSGGEDRLSEAEFRDQAVAICRRLAETRLPEPDDRVSGLSDYLRYLDESIRMGEEATLDFRALKPPEHFQSQWNRYTQGLDEGLEIAQEFRDSFEEVPIDEVERLADKFVADISRIEEDGNAIKDELGLDECLN